ncbi:MAG TPA: Uma2 family endonuclease [Pyrinomonadaceae bacterium]|nr:Uma2 family endonuclease [Pyrinomonadaceae bacterium]
MASNPNVYVTPEEYLELERQADCKSEYADGVVYAMAGASERHNLIVANIVAGLHAQLFGGRCRVYPSDLKVRAPKPRYFFYPDVSVVCGETKFHDEHKDVVLNPVVIFEVLSEATAAYDRGKKFQHYQQLDTLAEYVLVSQDDATVERYVRREDGSWIYTKLSGLDVSLVLSSIKCELELRFIYANAL